MARIATPHRFVDFIKRGLACVVATAAMTGCQSASHHDDPSPLAAADVSTVQASSADLPANALPSAALPNASPTSSRTGEILPVAFDQADVESNPVASSGPSEPPRVDQFDMLPRRPMSLDMAVQLALNNSMIIGDLGGRVLTMPESVRSTLDPGLVSSDPRIGIDAALSTYDLQFESGLVYNGGGNIVNSAFASGQFGVFAQPETLAKAGVGRMLRNGTAVSLGGVAGYDEELAGGPFAAFSGDIRHPLMRGAGREFNDIAGPSRRPGTYGGILIATSKKHQSQLALEQAVTQLVHDVGATYWELHYAYLDVATKQVALGNTVEILQLVQQRVDAAVAPADHAALARQQMHAAEAALASAISGTKYSGSGVYSSELRLRTLLGLPTADGSLIIPDAIPLRAQIIFDWNETLQLAHANRVELRKQTNAIKQQEMEIKAARNLQRTQVDLLGTFRKLGDDPDTQSPLFGQALDGWQVGVEVRRSVSNRLEDAAVRNSRLRLRREVAVLHSQQQAIDAELQSALTQLDRTWAVIQSLTAAESAAQMRLAAQTQRHRAGDDRVEDVLAAQSEVTRASTALQRAIVDYNLAFIGLHHARGTLLPTIGVGLAHHRNADEIRFAQRSASVYKR